MVKKTSDEKKLARLSHHAYVVRGNVLSAKSEIFRIAEDELEVKTEGNPDFVYEKFESLSVDEVRNIKSLAESKSFEFEGKKVFVIEALSITREAQNSLLKVLEEPTDKTYFFIFGNCAENLIPTILSRVSLIDLREGNSAGEDSAEKFLELSLAKRLNFVKKLSDDIKDEKKSRGEAISFLQDVERAVYEKFKSDPKALAGKLEKIETCRDFINDRSSSIKMILEFLAIITP